MPDHWHETTLGEVAALNSESVRGQDEGFKFRYVDIGSVSASSGISTESLESHELGTAPSRAQRIIRSADVLVSTVRPNLRAFAQVPAELDGEVASTGFAVVRARDRVEPSFLWVLVRSEAFVGHLIERATGSNYPAVKSADVGSFAFALPPLQEQRRIVDLVRSIDTYIDSLETQIETTRTARSALLSELLSNPGDDWQETTLGVHASVRTGSLDVNASVKGGRYPFFTCAREVYEIDTAAFSGPSTLVAGNGDFNVKYFDGEFNAYQRTYVIQSITPTSLAHRYLNLILEVAIETIRLDSRGTTIKYLKKGQFTDYSFALPPISDQKMIVDLVGSFDEQILSLELQVESVRVLRTGVLSELLAGECLLDDSYDMAVGL